jgi:hypothetical protein
MVKKGNIQKEIKAIGRSRKNQSEELLKSEQNEI